MRLLDLHSHTVPQAGLENIYFFYQHNWRKSDTNTIGHLAVEQMVSLVHSSRLREMKYGYGERVCVDGIFHRKWEDSSSSFDISKLIFTPFPFLRCCYVLPTFSERSPHRVSSRAFSVISLNHYQRKPLLSLVLESPFHLILSWWIFSPKRQKNRPFEITAKSFPNCFIGPKPFVHRQKLFLAEKRNPILCGILQWFT